MGSQIKSGTKLKLKSIGDEKLKTYKENRNFCPSPKIATPLVIYF